MRWHEKGEAENLATVMQLSARERARHYVHTKKKQLTTLLLATFCPFPYKNTLLLSCKSHRTHPLSR